MSDEFDPELLKEIELNIVPLLEKLVDQTLSLAKSKPGQIISAPVPFIFDDDVMFEDDKYLYIDFHGDQSETSEITEAKDWLVTAWVTHVMAELDEGDQYNFEDLIRMISNSIDAAA